MLYTDFTAKLLEMEDVIVDSVVHHAEIVEIHLQQQVKACVCPVCGKAEYVVHDYRSQRIRDTSAQGTVLRVDIFIGIKTDLIIILVRSAFLRHRQRLLALHLCIC